MQYIKAGKKISEERAHNKMQLRFLRAKTLKHLKLCWPECEKCRCQQVGLKTQLSPDNYKNSRFSLIDLHINAAKIDKMITEINPDVSKLMEKISF